MKEKYWFIPYPTDAAIGMSYGYKFKVALIEGFHWRNFPKTGRRAYIQKALAEPCKEGICCDTTRH